MKNKKPFIPRIVQIDGIYVFAGPCAKCPSYVEPWIKQFCSLQGNEWYVQIDEEWAGDNFNHFGLQECIPDYEIALEMVTDKHGNEWSSFSDQTLSKIVAQSRHLFGLMHARYICQSEGLRQIKKRYINGTFGKCPRFLCSGEKLVPVGISQKIKRHSVKLFCPQCNDIYKAPSSIKIDGAHFGPAFPHIFFSSYVEFDSFSRFKPFSEYVFGFPVHPSKRISSPHSTNDHNMTPQLF